MFLRGDSDTRQNWKEPALCSGLFLIVHRYVRYVFFEHRQLPQVRVLLPQARAAAQVFPSHAAMQFVGFELDLEFMAAVVTEKKA